MYDRTPTRREREALALARRLSDREQRARVSACVDAWNARTLALAAEQRAEQPSSGYALAHRIGTLPEYLP